MKAVIFWDIRQPFEKLAASGRHQVCCGKAVSSQPLRDKG